MEYLHTLLYICPLVFLAGFIDSSAGGGGLISIPAFLLTGMPTHLAFGTNKLTAALGTSVAAGRFIKNRSVDFRTVVVSALCSGLGAAGGSWLVLHLDDRAFRLLLIIALPCVAVFLLTRRKAGEVDNEEETTPRRSALLAGIIGAGIGVYDGIIGPGTGTFAIIAYHAIMGYDYRTAAGNAKVLNLASNIGSIVTFLLAGHVLLLIALPAALFNIAGNYVGSGIAIKRGAKFIRPMLVFVLALLLIKVVSDFIGML